MATKKTPKSKRPKTSESAVLHLKWVDGINSGTKKLAGVTPVEGRTRDTDKELVKQFKALLAAQEKALAAVQKIVAIRKAEADVAGDADKTESCDLAVSKIEAEIAALKEELGIAAAPAAEPVEAKPAKAAKKVKADARPAAKKVVAKKAAKKVAAKKTKG